MATGSVQCYAIATPQMDFSQLHISPDPIAILYLAGVDNTVDEAGEIAIFQLTADPVFGPPVEYPWAESWIIYRAGGWEPQGGSIGVTFVWFGEGEPGVLCSCSGACAVVGGGCGSGACPGAPAGNGPPAGPSSPPRPGVSPMVAGVPAVQGRQR